MNTRDEGQREEYQSGKWSLTCLETVEGHFLLLQSNSVYPSFLKTKYLLASDLSLEVWYKEWYLRGAFITLKAKS